MLRVWQTIAITLVALTMGTSFAHVLELPAKLHYSGEFYLRLQTSLYAYWGPPSITGFVEPAAVLSVLFLAVLCRRRPVTLRLTLGSVICLLLAFPVVFFWRVAPANETFFHAAHAEILPADWNSSRMRWEMGHAIRFVLHLTAFVLLALSLTSERAETLPREALQRR
jgi:Domain of unknown function (DUF1772)